VSFSGLHFTLENTVFTAYILQNQFII